MLETTKQLRRPLLEMISAGFLHKLSTDTSRRQVSFGGGWQGRKAHFSVCLQRQKVFYQRMNLIDGTSSHMFGWKVVCWNEGACLVWSRWGFSILPVHSRGWGGDDEGWRLQEQRWGKRVGGGLCPTLLSSVTIPFVAFLSGGRHTGRVAATGIEALPRQIANITTHGAEKKLEKEREGECDINREWWVSQKKGKEQRVKKEWSSGWTANRAELIKAENKRWQLVR